MICGVEIMFARVVSKFVYFLTSFTRLGSGICMLFHLNFMSSEEDEKLWSIKREKVLKVPSKEHKGGQTFYSLVHGKSLNQKHNHNGLVLHV